MKFWKSLKSTLATSLIATAVATFSGTLSAETKTPRPYKISGKIYQPITKREARGFIERGVASWYGNYPKTAVTANGERFRESDFTAAHKTLPINSKVKVTNLKNNKSVVVRINDRGPFVKGRIIDLTPAAFSKINSLTNGTASVKIEVL